MIAANTYTAGQLKLTFQAPATRGRMGTTYYYTATLPFGPATKLFVFDLEEVLELSLEYRRQRVLKFKRIPKIAIYVLENEDYLFSAITVSVDADEVHFFPADGGADIGILVLPLDVKYVINDSQHHVAGALGALRQDGTTMPCPAEVPLFKDRIDKERVSLSVRSLKSVILSALKGAYGHLLNSLPEKLVDFCTRLTGLAEFWSA